MQPPPPVRCSIHFSNAPRGTRTVLAPATRIVGRTPVCIQRKAKAREIPRIRATSPPLSSSWSGDNGIRVPCAVALPPPSVRIRGCSVLPPGVRPLRVDEIMSAIKIALARHKKQIYNMAYLWRLNPMMLPIRPQGLQTHQTEWDAACTVPTCSCPLRSELRAAG
jgi:hypothetical protein